MDSCKINSEELMTNNELIVALVNQTDLNIDDFTGAAIIQTMINNKSILKYKVSLYFGYENNKPLTRIMEVDRDVFFALPLALDEYLSNVVSDMLYVRVELYLKFSNKIYKLS